MQMHTSYDFASDERREKPQRSSRFIRHRLNVQAAVYELVCKRIIATHVQAVFKESQRRLRAKRRKQINSEESAAIMGQQCSAGSVQSAETMQPQ